MTLTSYLASPLSTHTKLYKALPPKPQSFALLDSPSHRHVTLSVAPVAEKDVGGVSRGTGAAVQGDRDVRDDMREPSCSLDLPSHCHRLLLQR